MDTLRVRYDQHGEDSFAETWEQVLSLPGPGILPGTRESFIVLAAPDGTLLTPTAREIVSAEFEARRPSTASRPTAKPSEDIPTSNPVVDRDKRRVDSDQSRSRAYAHLLPRRAAEGNGQCGVIVRPLLRKVAVALRVELQDEPRT